MSLIQQVLPFFLIGARNTLIYYMLKDSAIVSVISGTDLTSVLQFFVFRNSSQPIPLYALAIVLYLLMSLPISYVARWYERRLRAAL